MIADEVTAEAPTGVSPVAGVAAPSRRARSGFSWLQSKHGLRWRVWDLAVGLGAFWIAFHISPYTQKMPAVYYMLTVGGLYGYLLSTISQACGVPRPERRVSTYELVVTSLLAVGMAFVIFNSIVGLTLVRTYGRYIVATTLGVSLAGLCLPRYILAAMMAYRPLGVLLFGSGRKAAACAHRLRESAFFRIVGVIDDGDGDVPRSSGGLPRFGTLDELTEERLRGHEVDIVVLCAGAEAIQRCTAPLLRLHRAGVELLTIGALYEQYFRLVDIDDDSLHLFASKPFIMHNSSILAAKRLMDLGVAAAGLCLTLPLWPVIALLIRLDGPGPILFRQTRVKRHGELFTIYKFRSMRVDAERNGAQWAAKDDPRVTRIGRFLRLTRLDELPQLWNVLRGDMSVVGPRPERPEFMERLCGSVPFYEQRHLVPPGLTGWAQICYRYGASEEDARQKLAYDLYYVSNISITLDLEIMLRTIPMLMKGSR